MFCGALVRVLVIYLKQAKAHAGRSASIYLSLIVGGILSVIAAVFEAIAFTVHLENVYVMCQPVQQCTGQSL